MKKLIMMSAMSLTCFAFGQDFDWATSIHSRNQHPRHKETVQSTVTDNVGNVYGVGHFSGRVFFDGPNQSLQLVAQGDQDIFVQKWDPNGNVLWVKRIGSGGSDAANDIEILGNKLFITGYFEEAVDFDPGPGVQVEIANEKDGFVLSLNSQGGFNWVQTISGGDDNEGYSIAHSKSSEHVYVTGSYSKEVLGTSLSNLSPTPNCFILGLWNNNGYFAYSQEITSPDPCKGQGIATDKNHVYVIGSYGGSANLVGTGVFGSNLFLGKLNLDLTPTGFFMPMRGEIPEYSHSICTNKQNELFYTGYFTGTEQFGMTPLTVKTSNGLADIFVAKINGSLTVTDVETFGSSLNDVGYCIEANTCNEIVIGGSFSNKIDFGNPSGNLTLVAVDKTDAFITALSADNLDFRWSNSLGTEVDDYTRTVAIDRNLNVFAAGKFNGLATFSSGTPFLQSNFSSPSLREDFLVKVNGYSSQLNGPYGQSTGHCAISYSVNFVSTNPNFTPIYKWQILDWGQSQWADVQNGTMNGLNYSGEMTSQLTVGYAGAGRYRKYRCIVTNACPEIIISSPVALDLRTFTCGGIIFGKSGEVSGVTDSDDLGYEVYPNPSNSGIFNVDMHTFSENKTIQVLDIYGKIVLESNVLDNKTAINLSQFSKGMYLIHLTDGINTEVKKVVFE